jgi:hypothetical protein
MSSFATVVAILVGAAILGVTAVLLYALANRRNRRTGEHGFVQHSRLTCPRCGQLFDYDWVPGGALTAVRFGKKRYMACPLCHRWSMFNVWDSPPPPGA